MTRRQAIWSLCIIILLIVGTFVVSYFGPLIFPDLYKVLWLIILATVSVISFIVLIIKGINQYEAFLSRKLSREISNKRVAKSILRQLHYVGYRGARVDLFNTYVIREHNELSKDERMQLCDELEFCGFIHRTDNEMVRITKKGENYIK